jgi:hypothetical protein
MALKVVHDTVDEIDEAYRPLYTERDGKFHLTGVEGFKTQADIDRLQNALTKERGDHKTVKDRLALFNDLDPEEVHAKLDKLPELEAAAEGKLDEAKISELADTRLRTKLAPVERERDQLKTKLEASENTVQELQGTLRSRDIKDNVLAAALKGKVVETALDDVLMLADRVFEVGEDGAVTTKDNVGVTPGLTPDAWLTEMQPKRPHWWPPSEGGGAQGGKGGGGGFANNPWSHEHWNMTEQGRIINQDRSKADQMAKAAGTSIGGPKPAAKK